MKTNLVSPIDLKVGDRVLEHGAIVEVVLITESPCDIPGGIRVAACTSRLVGDDMGAIPRGYWETPETYKWRGWKVGAELPDGLYWNVQGNAHARVNKIIA